jgi:hypothetical protein
MFVHQAVLYTVEIDVLEIMYHHIERWPLVTHFRIPLEQIHVTLRGIAGLADHNDVVHLIGPTFTPWEYMVFSKFRWFHLLTAIPAIVVMLYLRDVELEEVVNVPSSFLISLERFGTNHIAHTVISLHIVIQRIV